MNTDNSIKVDKLPEPKHYLVNGKTIAGAKDETHAIEIYKESKRVTGP